MKTLPIKATCQRCGNQIPMGRAKYDVTVEVVADFDGYLPDLDDEEEEMERVLRDVRLAREQDLEGEVFQEFTLTLCRSCMRQVVDEIRAFADEESGPSRDPKMNLQ